MCYINGVVLFVAIVFCEFLQCLVGPEGRHSWFHQVLDRVVPFCLWLWCICSDRVVLFAAFVYSEFLRCSGRSLSLPNALSHTWGGKSGQLCWHWACFLLRADVMLPTGFNMFRVDSSISKSYFFKFWIKWITLVEVVYIYECHIYIDMNAIYIWMPYIYICIYICIHTHVWTFIHRKNCGQD